MFSGHRRSCCCHRLSPVASVVLASRTLCGAICSSIFSTIIDQAPFAIEDLIAEVKAAEGLESDDDEDEEDEEDEGGEAAMTSAGTKGTKKQINGAFPPHDVVSSEPFVSK